MSSLAFHIGVPVQKIQAVFFQGATSRHKAPTPRPEGRAGGKGAPRSAPAVFRPRSGHAGGDGEIVSGKKMESIGQPMRRQRVYMKNQRGDGIIRVGVVAGGELWRVKFR